MSKTIKPSDLSKALSEQLTLYHESLIQRLNTAGEKAIKALVQKTKAAAPTREREGDFKKHIAYQVVDKGNGMKSFVWYVKSPFYRLTHLLVNGHATRNGGRTKADPFLSNALDAVLPEYEKDVEETVKDD